MLAVQAVQKEAQVLKHSLCQVNTVIFPEILQKILTNYCVLTEVVKIHVELISLLGHCCQNYSLDQVMNALDFALLSELEVLC